MAYLDLSSGVYPLSIYFVNRDSKCILFDFAITKILLQNIEDIQTRILLGTVVREDMARANRFSRAIQVELDDV